MGHLIEDFVEASNGSSSKTEVFGLYQQVLEKLGFDRVVYTYVTDHFAIQQRAGHGIECNYPSDWMAHYQDNNYQLIDPVIMRVQQTNQAFAWRNIPEDSPLSRQQCNLLLEAQEAGLHSGVGVPLHSHCGSIAGVGISCSDKGLAINKHLLSLLQLVSQQFHMTYCVLSAQGKNKAIPALTDREKEVLKWLAIGKSVEDIGEVMQVSSETIKFHIKNIYEKLEANSKILAVTKTIRYCIIPLHSLHIL